MKSLYSLITRTNLKSPTLAFPLVFPLIFVLLYSVGIAENLGVDDVNKLVSGFFVTILAMTTMQSGLMGFGINFISIKKSVLLKRIGATELSKLDVVLAVLFFGLTLWLISIVWIFIIMIFFAAIGTFYSVDPITGAHATATAFGWMANVQWGRLFLATLVMLYSSYGIGLFFTSVAHDDQMYMGMAMMYFFFAGFIGGIMFPGATPDWMTYLGYAIPHTYVGFLYDWAYSADATIQTWELTTGILIPLAFGTLMIFGGAKLLKFD